MKLLNTFVCFTITLTFLSLILLAEAWLDYDLVTVEAVNDTTDPMEYHITKKRINRFTFAIDGTIAFKTLDALEAELKIWFAPPDSSKYALSPFKIPRSPIKASLNQDYRKFIMKQVKEYSDLPYSEDDSEDLLPEFMNKKFTVKEFMLYNSTIPADMADGTYKCYLYIYRGMETLNGIYVMLKLY